jgi:hypothetical protein
VPKAAPIIMPTAISTTLPRMANSLNSFNIFDSSLFLFYYCHTANKPSPRTRKSLFGGIVRLLNEPKAGRDLDSIVFLLEDLFFKI